jgi:hypothetical protein
MDHRKAVLVALFAGLAIAGANAAPRQDASAAGTPQVSCTRLPLSERSICQSETARRAVTAPALTPAQQRALQGENARYRAELAQCQRMPLSERNTCISDAGSAAALATRS